MSLDDHDLITRAQRGDTRAFEQLVYRYDKRVLSLALSYSKDEDEAKDIYQEVFIRVYRALSGFRFHSQFSTWLYRIVINVCLTHQGRRKSHTYVSMDEGPGEDMDHQTPIALVDDTEADHLAMNEEITAHVNNAMASLSPQQRMVFTLKHYEGYKIREIAGMMDCAEGTVKKYLFTATERMRAHLKTIYQ